MADSAMATRATLALAAGTMIGVGLRQPAIIAVGMILFASVLLLYATVISAAPTARMNGPRVFRAVLTVSLIAGLVLVVSWTVLIVRVRDLGAGPMWPAILAVVVGSAIGVFVSREQARRYHIVFLLVFMALQVAVIAATHEALVSTPQVDGTYFQTEGSKALLSGDNPFAMTFPDFFSGFGGEPVYGPGVSVDGVLQFGFPYPPLSLLFVAPFHAVFGDFRVAIALSYVLTAWMIGRIGEPRTARKVSVLFLLLSPAALIVTVGFTEPLVAMLGVGVIWVYQTRPRWAAFTFGGFVALKQYAFIISPAYLLLIPRPWTVRIVARHVGRATAVIAVVTLPFLLWNPEAMMRSVVFLQLKQPFRGDAITFTAQVLARYIPLSPVALTVLPIAAAALAAYVALRYAPIGSQGYALASALILVAFFLFAKQSSAPNYFVVVMAFCFSAGAMHPRSSDPGERGEPADSLADTDFRLG